MEYDYNYDYNYDFEYTRSHVPAFGSWDLNNNLPFTQCFESARQAGLLRYSYSRNRDMYVTSDLYDNNVVTPAMIVVPRGMGKACATEGKKDAWVVYDYAYDHDYNYDCDAKEPQPEQPRNHVKQKAVDEDLYRISPELG
ncbi:uncharacterized protein LOC143583883 [Bidens hawaiensis]|uniref:uncharacterized protein LOC143583883 n=1 Tax=Bidens hawaiensis TaxID=980011 RepID=UPI00404A997B